MKKIDRKTVYDKCAGHCAYCGCEIAIKGMHVDHVEPVFRYSVWSSEKHRYIPTGEMWRKNNDNMDNLLPSCAPCNLWKGAMGLDDFRDSVRTQIDKIKKINGGFRLLMRFGIVTVNDPPELFYFERMTP